MFFWLFETLTISKKYNIGIAVKYTSSCTNNNASYIYVDGGVNKVKGIYNQTAYVRLAPGTHQLTVSHGWCNFFPATVYVSNNGDATALIDGLRYTEQPFPIQHEKLVDETDPINMIKNLGIFPIVGFLLIFVLPRYLCSPSKVAKLQEMVQEQQAQIQKAQDEMKKQQKRR